MDRRELLEGIAMAGIVGATTARAAEPSMTGHDHVAMGRYTELVTATSRCVNSGETCIAHCLTLLGEGEKDLAGCAETVQDIIASCAALRQLAAANSPHVARLASVVGEICKDCETECRKHEKKHRVCHDCAEACAQCAKECQNAVNA